MKRCARVFATFFIFGGAYAFGMALGTALLPRISWLLALAAGIGGAWFLRSRDSRPRSEVVQVAATIPDEVTPKPGWLNKNWKRSLAICVGGAAVATIPLFVFLADSEVSKLAFAEAQGNLAVRQRLGEPVKRGFFSSGNIEISGPSGRADIAIPISGPKGKGTLYVVARKSAGLWSFSTLQVAVDGQAERVDLLKQPADSSQSAPR